MATNNAVDTAVFKFSKEYKDKLKRNELAYGSLHQAIITIHHIVGEKLQALPASEKFLKPKISSSIVYQFFFTFFSDESKGGQENNMYFPIPHSTLCFPSPQILHKL